MAKRFTYFRRPHLLQLTWACTGLLFCIGSAFPRVLAQDQTGGAAAATTNTALVSMEGRVEVSRSGMQNWVSAQQDMNLGIGDRVRTALRSRAAVRFSNLTVLRLNQLTTIEIQPPQSEGSTPTLNMGAGAAYFFNKGKTTDMPFRTPVACRI